MGFYALRLPLALGFFFNSLGGISYYGILLAQWSHYFFHLSFWSDLPQEIEFKDLRYPSMCLPVVLGFFLNKILRNCVILLMGLWAYLYCFRTFALGFFPDKIPRNCVILLIGLWTLWAYLYCFGTFALSFFPNKIPRNCVILLMGLWAYLCCFRTFVLGFFSIKF